MFYGHSAENLLMEKKLQKIRLFLAENQFPFKIYLSWAVLSQDSKNVIYFYIWQLGMPKIAFQKYDVITFTCFFAIAQSKTKTLLWNLVCMLSVCTSIKYVLFLFLDKFEILVFIGNYFQKFNFWILSVKIEKTSKIQDSHFVKRLILRRLAFFDCVLLQNLTF